MDKSDKKDVDGAVTSEAIKRATEAVMKASSVSKEAETRQEVKDDQNSSQWVFGASAKKQPISTNEEQKESLAAKETTNQEKEVVVEVAKPVSRKSHKSIFLL